MRNLRSNQVMAARVEEGLYVQRISTTRKAASYMAQHGVPMHVAVRVLSTPFKRDMQVSMAGAPTWRDIVSSSGPTFGFPAGIR